MTNEPRFILHCRAIVKSDKPAEYVYQRTLAGEQLPRRLHFPVTVRAARLACHHWDTASDAKRYYLEEIFEDRPNMAITTLSRITREKLAA